VYWPIVGRDHGDDTDNAGESAGKFAEPICRQCRLFPVPKSCGWSSTQASGSTRCRSIGTPHRAQCSVMYSALTLLAQVGVLIEERDLVVVGQSQHTLAPFALESPNRLEPDALLDQRVITSGQLKVRSMLRRLPAIHGIPSEWIRTTLGQITRAVGTGRVRSLAAGGWCERKSDDRPYDVAPGFAAAWKKARGLP
jgi:hypothetical protein